MPEEAPLTAAEAAEAPGAEAPGAAGPGAKGPAPKSKGPSPGQSLKNLLKSAYDQNKNKGTKDEKTGYDPGKLMELFRQLEDFCNNMTNDRLDKMSENAKDFTKKAGEFFKNAKEFFNTKKEGKEDSSEESLDPKKADEFFENDEAAKDLLNQAVEDPGVKGAQANLNYSPVSMQPLPNSLRNDPTKDLGENPAVSSALSKPPEGQGGGQPGAGLNEEELANAAITAGTGVPVR